VSLTGYVNVSELRKDGSCYSWDSLVLLSRVENGTSFEGTLDNANQSLL
jgi:hypothetical protein